MNYTRLFWLLLIGLFFSCEEQTLIREWVSSTESNIWQEVLPNETDATSPATSTISLNSKNAEHQLKGFGASFYALGWESLNKLSSTDKASVLAEFFTPGTGANFTVARIPMGADHFSSDWHSYDEVEGDFELRYFSIEQDEKALIPFLQEAMHKNPNLIVWASPGVPPSWMIEDKLFITEELYLQAYASYFAKYIDAYRLKGIPISRITPQDEFHPSTYTLTPSGLAQFIRVLKPKMTERKVALYWGNQPKEGEGENDRERAFLLWNQIKHSLKQGDDIYAYGSIALPKEEMSQNALVVVDEATKSYEFTLDYYLMKHISHYVQPGARLLSITDESYQDALAFINPNKRVVVVSANQTEQPITLQLDIDGRQQVATMPPYSFHTWVCR